MQAMQTIAGYELMELLHEGSNTKLFRARSQSLRQPVVLKALKAENPTLEQITRIRYEYQIMDGLQSDHIVSAYGLEPHQNRLVLVLEDFGGASLKNWLEQQQTLTIHAFLNIATQLAEALTTLHNQHIIHKDIKPSNVIFNADLGLIKLTDFSIASRLDQETPQFANPNHLEGTLAYMSPEQTGRMNRLVDYRSDFYSLGVTFYELLTGQLPFQSDDPLEVVHCHLAKPSPPIEHYRADTPPAIAAIVAKLMAKNAEDRYQSAAGLLADLESCLQQLTTTGQIVHLTPGERDRTAQLLIPQKLYGRDHEVKCLMAAFDRVSQGASELMLVSGYSGIGKSSLINEIHKPVVRQRGYFISGKFDQFKRNIPYSSIIQAFQALMRQLLTESSDRLRSWRKRMLAALGNNGKVITDVIPEVELIIGVQPDVPALGATETQNRFNQIFRAFIHVFTQAEHPLVLFLDDLQWADSASLKLLHLVMTHPDSHHLMLIGAYRDNEVSPIHPLKKAIASVVESGATVNEIILQPLHANHVQEIIFDTLKYTSDYPTYRISELNSSVLPDIIQFSNLLFNKTQGNPFFLTQLLKTLHHDQLLQFDYSLGAWTWDLSTIQATGIADQSVVELIARTIGKLPEATQMALKFAACIGDRFNIDVLATVSKKTGLEIASALQPALQAGLILPLSKDYKIPLLFGDDELITYGFDPAQVVYRFLHDRVQQAAYSLIPEDQIAKTHLTIGQLLLQSTPSNALEANIFEIVNALNIGAEGLQNIEQRIELAQLNLIAGKKAKAATAYEPALNYLTQGINLLPSETWQTHYQLTLNLYSETAEAAYLCTDYNRSETLVSTIDYYAADILDKVKAYELRIQLQMAQLQMWNAIATGFEALSLLGITIACPLHHNHFDLTLPELDELNSFPVMTDPVQLAALHILMTLTSVSYQTQADIFQWVILNQLELCLNHGHSTAAVFAYMAYAWFCGTIGAADRAFQAGQISLTLHDEFHAIGLKSSIIQLFESFVRHQKEHIRETFIPLKESIQVGMETGDLAYVGYSAMNYCTHLFFSGEPLDQLSQEQQNYLDLITKLKQEFQQRYTQLWRQVTLNLQGKSDDPCQLVGTSFDATEIVPRFQQSKNQQSLFAYYTAETILHYLFQRYDDAIDSATQADIFARSGAGLVISPIYQFYYCLTVLSCCPPYTPTPTQVVALAPRIEQLRQWASSAPMNYQHKYELILAEQARVEGNVLDAMSYYDRSIEAALAHGYIQDAALANERAAAFFRDLGKLRVAKSYLTDAYYGYIQWGAIAKANQLQQQHPDVVEATTPVVFKPTDTILAASPKTTRSTSSHSTLLDLTTAMKAAEAIASELQLDQLLCRILRIIQENAGAQTGSLILEEEGELVIEAFDQDPNRTVVTLQSIPVEHSQDVPHSLIHYVARTRRPKVVDDALSDEITSVDPYVQTHHPKSLLCSPIFYQGKFLGVIYLENNLTVGAFTADRLELLNLLTSQAAIAIENARLYAREQEKSQQLRDSLIQLQQTQTQLVQTEKISQLGQLVAGVAHEVNNPVSFIAGNLTHANHYLNDLITHLQLYQREYAEPAASICEHAEEIDLNFLLDDLPKMVNSMKVGTDRIREIMQSLRNYSRVDGHERRPTDIHAGLDTTLMILSHRLKATANRPAIQVIKDYGTLPLVKGFSGQLNQVFMNLIANAIDAMEDAKGDRTNDLSTPPDTVTIRTQADDQWVTIRIADNGPGMPEEVREKLFEAFFTTKPEGRGTGLGLSISYQIITETHGGTLTCVSSPGNGAEFVIQLPILIEEEDE